MAKPKLEQVHEDFYRNAGDTVRIERGPPLKRAVATKELLHDSNTAPHYRAPRRFVDPETGETIERVSKDALGEDIRLGKEMAYLDHNLPNDQRGWYLYRLETENPRQITADHDDAGNPVRDKGGKIITKADDNHWVEVGYFDTFDEAVSAAEAL